LQIAEWKLNQRLRFLKWQVLLQTHPT